MIDSTLPEPLATIWRRVEVLRVQPDYLAWTAYERSFHQYSLGNRLMLRDQRPEATLVASRRQWASLGRTPTSSERPLRVMAPFGGGYRPVAVWDVSQTEGAALPTCPLRPVSAVDPGRLMSSLFALGAHLGLQVRLVQPSLVGARGWYSPSSREIALVSSFSLASQVRTLLHELSHAVTPDPCLQRLNYADREVTAELSAVIAASALPTIDLGDQPTAYLDSWLAGRVLPIRVALLGLTVGEHLRRLVSETAWAGSSRGRTPKGSSSTVSLTTAPVP